MDQTPSSSLIPHFPHLLHGGDYNPEQWPEAVWEEDDRLMSAAHWNSVTLGVFSWVTLEPEEGRYDFGWLDRMMDRQAKAGRKVGLATPSAAAPAWLSQKYPETLKMGIDRVRRKHGNRVNYCWSSPVYREKTRAMATQLAERYKDHPALGYWHVSNEFGGECYCELCEAAFRDWLKTRYGSLEVLNAAYWTAFWSHTFTDWEQIEAPNPAHGESSIIGLTIDWRRFTSAQIVDFYLNEANVLRAIAPGVPATTNLMGTYPVLNAWDIAPHIDFAAWDSYPWFHGTPGDLGTWVYNSFCHDLSRSLKDKPFLLMESSPSSSNWYPVMALKRPNAHLLEGMQAIAHGSDGVQYFQWRQGRGSSEQFHGAVVAHNNREDARVFQEVAEMGRSLNDIDEVAGSRVESQVAIVYDWEVAWAIEAVAAPRTEGRGYSETVLAHYTPFWEAGVSVDVVSSDHDFSKYKLVIAPMLFMLKDGVPESLATFVEKGGTLVTGYWSGVVDSTALAFVGGYPEPLRKVLGVWSEEIDALYPDTSLEIEALASEFFELGERFACRQLAELIHTEGASVLAQYGSDFYEGRPALTVNKFGEGEAYFVASRNDAAFQKGFLGRLIAKLELPRAVDVELPTGVTAKLRRGKDDYLFLLNFNVTEQSVTLGSGWKCAETGRALDEVRLAAFGTQMLVRETVDERAAIGSR